MLVNAIFEGKVDQLHDVAARLAAAMDAAGIPYRVVGGFATFLHIWPIDPLKAGLTADVDIAVDRRDLPRIAGAAGSYGFSLRHVVEIDTLVDAKEPRARSAVHIIFVGEKVRAEYVEAVPAFSNPVRTSTGLLLAPVADILRMKLTSFRMKDRVHIQALDSVGLITPEIEAGLSGILRARLAEVRATE